MISCTLIECHFLAWLRAMAEVLSPCALSKNITETTLTRHRFWVQVVGESSKRIFRLQVACGLFASFCLCEDNEFSLHPSTPIMTTPGFEITKHSLNVGAGCNAWLIFFFLFLREIHFYPAWTYTMHEKNPERAQSTFCNNMCLNRVFSKSRRRWRSHGFTSEKLTHCSFLPTVASPDPESQKAWTLTQPELLKCLNPPFRTASCSVVRCLFIPTPRLSTGSKSHTPPEISI